MPSTEAESSPTPNSLAAEEDLGIGWWPRDSKLYLATSAKRTENDNKRKQICDVRDVYKMTLGCHPHI